jgi:translation initiation factor IF-2
MWNTLDHQTIDDCIEETIEWRKSEKQREAEEIQEDHEKFITENPVLVENIFSSEMAELGFDPSKWKNNQNGSSPAEVVN